MIVTCLDLGGMSAGAVHKDRVATLGSHAVAYSSVTPYPGEARSLRSRKNSPPVEIEREVDDLDRAISFALSENRFASVREPSQLTRLAPSSMGPACSVRCTERGSDARVPPTAGDA
jgi:hypothetical protein